VVFAALACLALGWWQWQRYESASSTGQNLGYALQWPLFASQAMVPGVPRLRTR
jgi:DNA-binding transcriptional regulator of glucitol operon